MAWTHYRLCFRLLAPLHVGYRKTGNLMQTRPYVPGKNLWAALTETLVRRAGRGHDAGAYQAVGEILKQNFRFGYLWPAHGTRRSDDTWQPPTVPHFPWDEADPAYWDYLYLDGTAHTALDTAARAAAEGTLHEVEFIAPYTRKGQPVYLVGDLWVREDAQGSIVQALPAAPEWKAAMQRLSIGGERGYGWGRMSLCSEIREVSDGLSDVSIEVEERIPAHAIAVGDGSVPALAGAIEPLVGWEIRNGRYEVHHSAIAYVPGSSVETRTKFKVTPYGVLES